MRGAATGCRRLAAPAAALAAAVACGGVSYDKRFAPSTSPPDYIPVTIERGELRADCRLAHFEISIPPDAAAPALAQPDGDADGGWRLAVPKQRFRIATVCDLVYNTGARFRFSTVVDATGLDRIACAHRRSGRRSERHPPGSRRGRGVVLVCTNDEPALRSGGVTAGEGASDREAIAKDFPAAVEAFHAVMSPLWHAQKDPKGAEHICEARAALTARAAEVKQMVRPADAHGGEPDWTEATARLVDRVAAVSAACDEPGRPNVELELEGVHDAYHGVVSILHHPH